MTALARPFPKAPAHVQSFANVPGYELTLTFLLTFGGSELSLAKDPKGGGQVKALVGLDLAAALAASAETDRRIQKRIPAGESPRQLQCWFGKVPPPPQSPAVFMPATLPCAAG